MISYANINPEKKIDDLNNVVSCQKKEICELMRKLGMYDEVVTERDNLRELHNAFDHWKEKNKAEHEKMFTELLITCNDQTKKLMKAAAAEYKCEAKFNELKTKNDCIADQLNILKANENKRQCLLEDYENKIKCFQKDLCSTQLELEDRNCVVKKLKANLKCNEEEFIKMCRQLDECTKVCNRQNEANRALENELTCMKIKLDDIRSCAIRTEEKLKQERNSLADELKIKFKDLSSMEIRYDDVNRQLNEEKFNIKNLVKSFMDLKERSSRINNEMKNEIHKLKEEKRAKEDNLCCLTKKIKQLEREKDSRVMELSVHKNKLYEKECQLKQIKLLTEKIIQVKKECDVCCCFENKMKNADMCSCNASEKLKCILQKYVT